MKKKYAVITFLVSLLAIGIGFLSVRFYVDRYNKRTVVMDIDQSGNTSIQIGMEVTKNWVNKDEAGNETGIGAQYDGTIYNNSGQVFEDWTLTVFLPKEGKVDSLWNGEWNQEDAKSITITPVEYNTSFEDGGEDTFGFVLLSDEILTIENFRLEGHYRMEMHSLLAYNLLIAAFVIWVVCLITYIIVVVMVRMRTAEYKRRQEQDQELIFQSMNTFVGFIDAKDAYTNGHSNRVAEYTGMLAKRLGYQEEEVQRFYYIALMHDCGKIGIPDEILNKPGKLTEKERKIIESHTTIGGEILSNFTALAGIIEGARYHHERYDGKGYPEGLLGEDIPFVARLICVADSFDAMNSDRCYRKRLPKKIILEELRENDGLQFDPVIVKHMITMIEEELVETIE